jgi:beta-aspartyl-peptidase (threonine type)
MTPDLVDKDAEAAYRRGLEKALAAGYDVLAVGGPSLDAVQASVTALEECPLFNAGLGAAYNRDGEHELEAAIMDGKSRAAGSVAGLRHVRNPVALARLVMAKTGHVMMVGAGAEDFALAQGLSPVANTFFDTPTALAVFRRERDAVGAPDPRGGTVGAVALDRWGNLAAATSTGGTVGKLPGRVGDAPLVGSGTYADNRTCAVSCTGLGEYFIRALVAHDVSARIAYLGLSLPQAAQAGLDQVGALGGGGGLVSIDAEGKVAMPFTTRSMFRGYRLNDQPAVIKLFEAE